MTIRIAIEHRTSYSFDKPITIHPHTIRLRPAPHSRTPILSYSLEIEPKNHFLNWQQDPFGNYVARVVFPEKSDRLSINVGVVADMTVVNPFDFFVEEYAESYPFSYPDGLRQELEPYLRRVDEDADGSGPGPLFREWMDRNIPSDKRAGQLGIVDFLVLVNQRVNADIAYTVRMEPGVQSPDTTLQKAIGSCRDSAWLLVAVLRELGLAARFVSGYLIQLTEDLPPSDGRVTLAEDFTDLHAWAEVFIPGAGWIGLDATSGLFAGEGHIPLSATPHPGSSAPISGATEPAEVTFDFANTVRRIHQDARVTKPYDEQQWNAIDRLGHHVDDQLRAGNVHLTMGGEPTFVSAGDHHSPQWEGAADGPEKRELASKLAGILRRRWAANGLTQHGQGKWYPGEPVPRWQIALSWRDDGEALWQDQNLLEDPWSEPDTAWLENRNSILEKFAVQTAARLGVPRDVVQPAYDDTVASLLFEAQQPKGERPEIDPDPSDESLQDEESRQSIVDELDNRHLDDPRGFVVPLFSDPDGEGWATARWRTRRKHLFLTQGTSPLGLRLPLSSIAWGEVPVTPEKSSFDPFPPLREVLGEAADSVEPARELAIEDAPRTALTVEERDGHLFVFLPPLEELTDSIALLRALEATAADLHQPVVLEGYPLPGDPRVQTLTVTPDPGVIEVNVQPTATWEDLSELTRSLFDDARTAGLATEKFDLDGAHTGTGGGNHITLGGSRPADSPLLRRPDLLRSLVTFWQHHPSLSYVFSGRFIGPTSQAPRVDEGRHETLYELEIAFAELEHILNDPAYPNDVGRDVAADKDHTEPAEERWKRRRTSQPWLTDRLFRHLLTDITGNTHRSEFCIDKMYSPDSARGRLGLLEMRGFEMPPHPQMSLLQALLVRSLVARFWDEPYSGSLVRWGTRLHDRFLLPAFAAHDLRSVVADLNRYLASTADDAPQFDDRWFEPFLEFRFPRLGETDVDGVHLELRTGVEPWNVLGEEVGQSGTSRYVDSSVERVQVAATGLVEGRHVITCNGVPVPLVTMPAASWGVGTHDTVGASEAKVGGIRYRAWAPPSALHPTIGVHSPLTFDVVDRWSGVSLGGFTYHVVHPGGRSYDRYPVNAAEAESRRSNRFTVTGHTSGKVDTSDWPAAGAVMHPNSAEYPATLDLRRFDRGIR